MTRDADVEAARLEAVRRHIRQRPQAVERLTYDEVVIVAERIGLVKQTGERG